MTRPGPDEGDLFNAALDQPVGPARAAFLDRECGDDQELRARIEALLKAHDSAGGFFGGAGDPDSESLDASPDAVAIREGPGTRIGRYKLLEAIGEGGFGVVYMAEQEEPVRRRVALKIIKLGMDTRAVVARFEAERQALAMMDHPNIAKVFDGGATDTGRPYFVMDLVQGVTITTFCNEHRLSTRERIELFTQVCHAVQHAHQKGIIHRDLKPSNILVTLHDDRPVPKVIDFGIAKATEQRLTEKTLFTRFHQFIGTPVYMSPEQTGISGLDIDTRSDIYSLGVLLYELLAGHTPFDDQALMKAGYDEIHRIIREKDPPVPSHRLSSLSLEDQTATAQRRRSDPAKLTSELRGDLDRIVMKCLEKDRTRRYETANGLAADLRRHLNDEPILARPGSARYRIAKFIRRHSRGVVVTVAVTLLLITLVALYTTRLAAERDRARRESEKAARVTQLLTDLLTGSDPYGSTRSREPTVREVLDAGAERVQKELSAQPDLESEILTVIGYVYQSLGAYDKAQPLLERSLTIAQHSNTFKPEQLARILHELGTIAAKRGDYGAAHKLFDEALALRLKLFGAESLEVADTLTGLGRVFRDDGSMARAEPLFREALSISQKKLGEDNRVTAACMSDLAHVLRAKGDLDGAEELFRRAFTIVRKVLGDDNPETGEALANVALMRCDRGDYATGVTLLREAIPISRKVLGANHPDVAMMVSDLGYALWGAGKPDEAAPVLEEAVASMRIAFHGDHPRMAMSLSYLARVRLAQGNPAAAEPLLQEALKIRLHIWAADDWRLAATKSLLGAALTGLARYREAETMLLAAYRGLKFDKGVEGRAAEDTRERLVTLYEAWGQPDKAAHYRGQAVK